jgi:hypothetical protein
MAEGDKRAEGTRETRGQRWQREQRKQRETRGIRGIRGEFLKVILVINIGCCAM